MIPRLAAKGRMVRLFECIRIVSIAGLTFGDALQALKAGKRVARAGWNGKGMFVYYVRAAAYLAQSAAAIEYFGENAYVPYAPYLALKGVDERVSTWVPSINDVLVEDWVVLE